MTDGATIPFALRSRRVVMPDGERPATVVVRGEKIDAVLPHEDADVQLVDVNLLDVGDLVISPGVVDAHVHVNEPGRTEWEGFVTATRAAAAGGVTTLVDMPLNSTPVTTTPEALEAKRSAALGQCRVDVGFYGGLSGGNTDRLGPLSDAGVLGVKAFLCPSGLDDFPAAGEEELEAGMRVLAEWGVPLLVHCELMRGAAPAAGDPRAYSDYLASRPDRWEVDAIELVIELCRRTGCAAHVVHLATAEALGPLRAAKAEGLPLTVETCPHYLLMAADEIPDADTRWKCAPPIRGPEAREALWGALIDGTIDTIGSDHSPCLPELKHFETGDTPGDFTRSWGGVAGLQFILPATWTAGVARGATPVDLARWLSAGPAELVGLSDRKGRIAPGFDADLVVWDPEASWNVAADDVLHRHLLTPYVGVELRSAVRQTYVRGRPVYADGRVAGGPPVGELLARR